MPDVPEEVGYLTVDFAGITTFADTDDAGSQPNSLPLDATVEYEPSGVTLSTADGSGAAVIATLPEGKKLVELPSGIAFFAGGKMVAAKDTAGTEASATGESVRLVAPSQLDVLNETGWSWKFTITLTRTGLVLVVPVTGAPGGDPINLANEIEAGNVLTYSNRLGYVLPLDVNSSDEAGSPGAKADAIAAGLAFFDARNWPRPPSFGVLDTSESPRVLYSIGAALA